MPSLANPIRFAGNSLPIHAPVNDRDNAVTLRDIGRPGGLELGQRMGKNDGRAAGDPRELIAGSAQLPRTVGFMHRADQIHPDAAGGG